MNHVRLPANQRARDRRYNFRRGAMLCVIVGLCLFFDLSHAVCAIAQVGKSDGSIDTASANARGDHPWGDQGDGRYVNPILPGDFSDLDAIRVGSDYYAISSTMQFSPGVVVLQTKDLVNWRFIGHVVQNIATIDPKLNWNGTGRTGRGIWAGSIRYEKGRFWVYFGTPDQGIFVSTSAAATGPWSRPKLVLRSPGWDDPCPFWDDDGREYLVATHFAPEPVTGTTYNIHLFQLNASGDQIVPRSDRIIHQSKGSEANKMYRIDGVYYHFYSEVSAEGRVPMMERARSLNGPWESHQLMHVNAPVDKEPNQGGFVETPSGRWYFLTHQGSGDWEGRAGVLLPVTWIQGWPVIGRPGTDGIGTMEWSAEKPVHGFPRTLLTTSGGFHEHLSPEWEWSYQPRAEMWSLTVRPGYLRLYAFPPVRQHEVNRVGNMITQRSFRTAENVATVTLDVSGMVDGQRAGLAHFAKTWCTLEVRQQNGVRKVYYQLQGRDVAGPVLQGNTIFLRSSWGFDGSSQFSYSTDGRTYRDFGEPYELTWGSYRGDRIGIFTVNSRAAAGYLDVEQFEYRIAR